MPEQLLLTAKPHDNHYLFSDYYLDNRVRERREWSETDVREGFEKVAGLWEERQSALLHANESQTESDWIRPILRMLGHHFAVQVSIQAQGGSKTPDYVFCPDEITRVRVQVHDAPAGEADLAGALAVGDAKAWDRPLDRTLKEGGVKSLHEHPGLQIDTYIRHSGLDWGILTNGRQWRLYHKNSSKRLDVFYEVDLPALLDADADDHACLEQFKYFWLFFRRQAFVPGSHAPGHPAWLDLVLTESQVYEQGVSEGLKGQVYDALQALAQGFVDYAPNGLSTDAETITAIHDNGLILLYRLLFILYAEDRDLLPVASNEAYRESYSLFALKQRIARDIDRQHPAMPGMSNLWQRLLELWRIIDTGYDALGVPAYNGGLFKAGNYPFLEQYRVGDSHLRIAIDLLTRIRDPKTGKAEFIDYRDLDIRHLGSVYEGLLEYNLRVAEEPLVAERVKGGEVFRPADGKKPDVRAGEVYLVTDKGERKATGSYYTPDYIVQYIVEHTVGPVLAEVAAPYLDAEGGVSDAAGLEKAILAINVLDPAMGSGHFLVAATDFIARFMVERGVGAGLAPARLLAPAQMGAGTGDREDTGDREGRPYDDEGELAYWRRRVAQACIYGVDLGPLAVELAKLSLWLATVSKDKPLSFLDHHLRCGNSLIGARVADLPLEGPPPKKQTAHQKRKEKAATEAGQLSMLDDSAFAGSMRTATGMMDMIEALGSETLANVHEAETIYQDSVRAVTAKARLVADLWTARHFGLDIPDDQWQPLVKYLLHGGFAMPGWDNLIDLGQKISRKRRFFHWELEFPEVFFDEHGRLQGETAGFDAVVGNPPYVRVQNLNRDDVAYFSRVFISASGNYDIYVLLVERGLQMLSRRGIFGYILPNKLFRVDYGNNIRKILAKGKHIQSIVDFGSAQVFEGSATTYTALLFLQKSPREALFEYLLLSDGYNPNALKSRVDHNIWRRDSYSNKNLDSTVWNFSSSSETKILERLHKKSIRLINICSNIARGVSTGDDSVFVLEITESSRQFTKVRSKHLPKDFDIETDILRTPIWATNFNKYTNSFVKNAVIFPYSRDSHSLISEIDLERRYPKTWSYMSLCREKLESRAQYDVWYAFSAPRNLTTHDKAHLLIPLLADKPSFSFYPQTQEQYLLMASGGFSITVSDEHGYSPLFILACINSKSLYYNLRAISNVFRGGWITCTKQYFGQLPVRRIHFTTPADKRERLLAEAKTLAAEAVSMDFGPVLDFVSEQLAAEPERSDVVHDLLAHLAEQMIDLNKQRQKLERALDPFKWLDRSATFAPFTQVFTEEIKYGELLRQPDLDAVRHDVEQLQLTPLGPPSQRGSKGKYELQAYLKHRDPATDWRKALKDENGKIVREWAPVYRFEMEPTRAQFYTHALPVLDQFTAYKKFPGGKTKTALQKLHGGRLPVFNPAIDLTPLEELTAELTLARARIMRTDELIDQIVYKLYGLTEEEIGIVEG